MKIVMAQLNPIIGDMEGNTEKIIGLIEAQKSSYQSIDFLVFPETCITGYPPLDLLDREGFIEEQNAFLEKIKNATKISPYNPACKFNVVIGAFSFNPENGKPLYNTLYVFREGNVAIKYNKMCLPTYNIFDELRHCEPGSRYQENVMVWRTHTIAFFICEDALSSKRDDGGRSLYKNDPVEDTFKKYENIDYVISINASPSNIGKFQLRERIFKRICKDHNVHAVYVNQVGSHDEVVYDGQSFIMNPDGKLIWVSDPLKESIDEVIVDYCKPVIMPSINCFKEQLYYEHAILGIKDFFHKQGFKKAVVACSGGIDSAVVLALAVEALRPENVEAITMPSKVSSAGSVDDSETLCKNLGVKLHKFPIFSVNDQFVDTYSNWVGTLNGPVTKQNIQPKIRTMCAMAFSNENGHLFLNSSNKTELTFGYGTMYGDLGGAVSPLGDIWKDDVFALARYINKIKNKEVIPVVIIDKIPSAELEVGQIDENDLGSYEVANAVGRLFIEQSMLSEEEKILCQITIKDKSNKEAVEKLIRRIDRNEHKRQQFGVIIRMRGKAFGMGRKMPIVQRHDNRNHPLLDLF